MQRDIEENVEEINGLREIMALAESIKNISESAFWLYKPIVEDICSRKTVSEKELENVLDGLLSVCISDKILGLFKQVGRRFYNQYPEIITDYVMFYKEMYGEEEGNE